MNDQPKRRGRPPKARQPVNEPVTLEQAAEDLMGVAREFEASGEWEKAEDVSILTIAPEDIEIVGEWSKDDGARDDMDFQRGLGRVEPEGDGASSRDSASVSPLTLPQIIALDRDHDGQPGGSWPFASLTENETRGLIAEFFEAYESQVETKRVDTFNRVWSFRHEAIHSQDTMVLSVKRGPVVAERHIPASMARFKDIADVLSELDAETAR